MSSVGFTQSIRMIVWAANDGGPSSRSLDGKTWEFELISSSRGRRFQRDLVGGNRPPFRGRNARPDSPPTGGEWTLEQKLDEGNFSTNLLQTIWAADFDNIYAGGNLGQLYRRNGDGTWTDLGFGGGIFNSYNIRAILGNFTHGYLLRDNNMIRHYTGSVIPPITVFSVRFAASGSSAQALGIACMRLERRVSFMSMCLMGQAQGFSHHFPREGFPFEAEVWSGPRDVVLMASLLMPTPSIRTRFR